MGIAIASGVERRETRLVTAIVAGSVISALGGSRQICGPTAAFIVVVYRVVETRVG